MAVHFPQGCGITIDKVQIAHQSLHTFVKRLIQKMPIQTLVVVPFAPLAKLATHKQQLLSRMRPHVSVQRAQVRKLLPLVARHFVQQRAFHVHNFIVRKRQDKVFAPRVNQAKRQRIVISAAKQSIRLKILERVVHPTHVPLEIKPQPAGVNRMTDLRPGG